MTVTSVEYKTIRNNRTLLKNAMVDDVPHVSSELLRLDMITDENHTDLQNNTLTKHDRVEKLMMYIENRVKLNPADFTKFVKVLKTKEEYYSKALQVLQMDVPDTTDQSLPIPTSDWQELIQLVKLHTKLKEELKTQGSHDTNSGFERRIKELEERMKETDQCIEHNPYWVVLSKGFQILFYLVAFTVLVYLFVVVTTMLVYLLVIVLPSAIIFIMQLLVKYSYTNFILLLFLHVLVSICKN